MSSNSRRGSTDSGDTSSGDEYTERDRQRISAEVDAAIAGGVMGASAFATGHQPDDKDNEDKPKTDHGGQSGDTSTRPSRSWINPKKNGKKNRPKKHMGNKALIVSNRWGGPIQGGVTDTVHLLIRLLRELGLSVYCTALTATEAEIKEAKEYGVELIVPSPIPRFKVRHETPNADWLYRHEDYFPHLKELANVRFVFGFGTINSDTAFKIEKDVFPKAEFYLINLFDRDVITPVIANCEAPELELRRENVIKEGQDSSSVFSVGGSIFKKYKKLYRKDLKIKHYRLSPMVDENHFKIPSPESVDDDEEFQILSLFQEHELAYLKSDSAIVKAMNSIADSFDKTKKSPLKWKILGVPKRCESELIELMNPHAHLDVIPARMPSAEHLNDVLGQSNLVLVHPYSVHYVNLTLAAMSAAIPVIVPARSLSHELIRVHTPEYEESIVVDMTKTNDLENRISEFLCKYEITLKRAKDIKGVIESKVKQELENINNDFFRVVKDDSEIKHGITLTREKPSDKKTQDLEENQKTEHQMFSRKRKMQGRDPCDIKLKIRVIEVVSERGRTIEEVERGFYESEEVKEQTEEVGEILDKQHDEMKVKDIGQGSISYTMSCQSLDALECLMRKYENGTLQDMMDNKFLSDNILDKIGAFHLAIDVTIDYEEYYLCRKELLKRHGLPLPKRQTYKIQPTISQMMGSTSRRVNRARYLLKSFEREGDKVTESQINTLDKLLQEKEEKRRIEQQQSVRESEKTAGRAESDSPQPGQHIQDHSEFTPMTDVHLLSDDQIAEKNEELEAKVSNLTISGRVIRSWNRERGRGRDILKSVVVEGDRTEKAQLNPLLSKFAEVKTETQVLATNHPEVVMKTEKLSAYADHIVSDAEIPEETKEVYLDVRRVDKG